MPKAKDEILRLIRFLPNYNDIVSLLEVKAEAAYILGKAIEHMRYVQEYKELPNEVETKETFYLVECLADNLWECIHTGHFSEVPLKMRKIFALANYYKIFYMLLEDLSSKQIEKCSALLDDSMLVGCMQDLYTQHSQLQESLVKFFDEVLGVSTSCELPILEIQTRKSTKNDVPTLECPSVMEFAKCCFEPQNPALLLNTLTHWPAIEKWRDLNYINKVAGNRCVPIEIGTNYTTDEWSQQILKISDFLHRQFTESFKSTEVEYLAQHELFDQIPALKADICIPDYCTLGTQSTSVDIKAWLGPKGTISPMHYDPKHNLLCQVFGNKFIKLAAPTDTEFLYPHETEFLNNTSQLDAEDINVKRFPLATKARFYNLILQAGDCLYIPPKWWHYVRAESASFSVSFWWD